MNNYQIYEDIGKGRHSTVYKGRKKRSIEYFAIASIDKGQRQRVLNSVRFIRALSHENVIKFHNWYETNNHLWVITEYCTGGDMKSVLGVEEQGFPEATTKVFAADLVDGFNHLHSNGVLYIDIKPSNILMDACAVLKLYDFGLASSVDDVKPNNRIGTPSYMAPELFMDGGVHSYASDIWSLGCLLFEMATGSPPFVATDLQSLINKIMHDPLPNKVPAGYSSSFQSLMESMLNKDPLQRASWTDIGNSEFWDGASRTLKVSEKYPPQPQFEQYRKQMQELQRQSMNNPNMLKDEAKKHALRASINAERNILRASRTSANGGGLAGNGVAKISLDHEVDFRDEDNTGGATTTGEAGQAQAQKPSPPSGGAGHVSEHEAASGRVQLEPRSSVHRQRQQSLIANDPALATAVATTNTVNSNRASHSTGTTTTAATAAAPHEHDRGNNGQENPANNPKNVAGGGSQKHGGQTGGDPSAATGHLPGGAGGQPSHEGAMGAADVLTVEGMMIHNSDHTVKPIMLNPRIERIGDPKYDPAELKQAFEPHPPQSVKEMTVNASDLFLATVRKSLNEVQGVPEKANILCYLQTLASDPHVANLIIGSTLTPDLVSLMQVPNLPPNVKALIATILGLLFRHAAVIPPELQQTNLLPYLLSLLSHQNSRVRRRAAASAGELLFYIATQTPESRAAWVVPENVASIVFSVLGDQDEVVVHYMVRLIENVASLADKTFAAHFATKDIVATLVLLFENPQQQQQAAGGQLPSISAGGDGGNPAPPTTRSEHLRASALGGALKLCLVDPLLIHMVVSTLPPSKYASIIGLTENSNQRTVQAMLTFINHLLCKAVAVLLLTAGEQHLVRFVQWTNLPPEQTTFSSSVLSSQMVMETTTQMLGEGLAFVQGINAALEHNNPAIRGKACLLTLLLTVVDPNFLTKLCEAKILPSIERLSRDQETYVSHSAVLLHTCLRAFVGTAMNSIAQFSPTQATTDVLSDLVVLSKLLGFSHLRVSLLQDERFFVDLGHSVRLLDEAQGTAAGGVDANVENVVATYQKNIFQLLEIVTQDREILSRLHSTILSYVGPPLTSLLKSGRQDLRFQALKVVFDIASGLLNDPEVYNPALGNQSQSLQQIHAYLMGLLPMVDSLLEEPEPIPLYTVKLLSVCCDRSSVILAQVARNTLIARLLSFFDPESVNNNIYVVLTLLRIIQSGGDALILYGIKNGLVSKVKVALGEVYNQVIQQHHSSRGMGSLGQGENMVDPCLEIMFFVLCSCAKTQNQQMLAEAAHWVPLVGSGLLTFCLQGSDTTAECSASCIHLLLKLFPQEGTFHELLNARSVVTVREILGSCENFSHHVTLPLLKGLLVAFQEMDVRQVAEIRTNELLLVQLQTVSQKPLGESGSPTNNPAAATHSNSTGEEIHRLAQECLNTLYSR